MRKLITFLTVMLLFTGQVFPQFDLLFNQPYTDGENAFTSAFETAGSIDYEAADNFFDVDEDIEEIIFYGITLKYDGAAWVEQTPGATEPFFIRFYLYEEGLTPGLQAPTTGTYQIALLDDYGDGWNGGLVSVFVNGNPVLTDITLATGAGPEYHNFTANAGDNISTVYTAGSWSYENYYAILDPAAIIIAEDGGTWANPGASTPTGIAPGGQLMVLEPDWANPEASQYITATVENIGTVWSGQHQLYKFTATLTTPVAMMDGWVSAQIDADNGSGTWFLWLNSLDGDGQSWHRLTPVVTRGSRETANLASVSAKGEGGSSRDQLGYDFALELWGGELTEPPACVINPNPGKNAIDVPVTTSLSWTSNPVATGYKIYFGTDNPPTNIENGTDLGLVTSYSPAAILSYSTQYYWSIIPYNAAGEPVSCDIWGFTTIDDPTIYYGDLPHLEDFDAVTVPALPFGWLKVGTTGSVQTQTSNPNSSPNCLYMWSSSSTSIAHIALPPVSMSGVELILKFWGRANFTTGGILEVGYLTDPSNASSFVLIEAKTMSTTTYQEYIVDLGLVNGVVNYAFRAWYDPANSMLIDDVTIEEKPECPAPTGLTATNTTASSAELGWTELGSATVWNIEWGDEDFVQGTGTTIPGVIDNPYELTGLNANTSYDFYVQADCGAKEESPWAGPFTFTTQFVAPTPYFEGFPVATAPAGWNITGWTIGTTTAIPPIDGNYIRRNLYDFAPSGVFTTVNIGPVSTGMFLTFDYALANWASPYAPPAIGSGNYIVSVSTDYGASYSILETVVNDGVAGWREKEYDLSTYDGENVKIKIEGIWISGDYYLAFDNFKVEVPPVAPIFAISPTEWDFGDVGLGEQSLPKVFTISNAGPGVLTVSAPTLDNDVDYTLDYEPTDYPAELEGAETVTFSVVFHPSVEGERYGEVSISYDDTEAIAIVELYGLGFLRPENDLCENAIEIDCSDGIIYGTTLLATPDDAPTCVTSNTSPGVWYLFNTESYADVTLSLCNTDPLWDTKLSVYIGDCDELICITGNDDFDGCGVLSQVAFFAEPNVDYYILVHGFSQNTGDFQLDIICETIDCPQPTALTATNITATSADLGWTPGGTETMWHVEVGAPGFAPGTAAALLSDYFTPDNPWLATPLTPETDYEFYVKAYCNGFDTPKIDRFWMAMPALGVLDPLLSGGTMDDPGETGEWYLYAFAEPQQWWNIWFYNGEFVPENMKKVRMGFWVQSLDGINPGEIQFVVNWSTPEWSLLPDPPTPFPMPIDEMYIERSPINPPMIVDPAEPQWIEFFYIIEDYNPEWLSVDIWGNNIQILEEYLIPPPPESPLAEFWTPGPGGIIVHECLPKDHSSSDWSESFFFSTPVSCPPPTDLTTLSTAIDGAEVSWTSAAPEFEIEYGEAPYTFTGNANVISIMTNSYTFIGLDPATTYQYKVKAICGEEDESLWSAVGSFTTDCPVFMPPFIEGFNNTPFPPQCWSRYSGLLADPSTLTSTTIGWTSDEWLNIISNPDKAAKINIYGTARYYWLVSPLLDLGDGSNTFEITFDLALMTWNTSNPPETDGTDDVFAVVISTDGGVTWTSANTLRLWDNVGSPYVYNDINHLGEEVVISLDGYTGVVQIGLYGGSTTSNADNDLMVNDFSIVLEEPAVPDNREVDGITLGVDDVECYDATITITVTNTVIGNGASAEFRAGENIIFGDGFVVESGAYMHAMITDVYCLLPDAIVSAEEVILPEEIPAIPVQESFFKVFPNPTTSTFKLELLGADEAARINVEIYGMMGERVFQDVLFGGSQYEFDLSNMPKGIYFIRVLMGDEMGIEKVIKQ